MLNRLKRALVDSYIGAIAIGWLLAEACVYFVGVFTAPVAQWVLHTELRGLSSFDKREGFPFESALSPLMSSVLLFLICYLLLRWLYFTPVNVTTPIQEQSD